MPEHTREPWTVHAHDGLNPFFKGIVAMLSMDVFVTTDSDRQAIDYEANAARIVACVNALAGVANPEAIPALIQAATETRDYLWAENQRAKDGTHYWHLAGLDNALAALDAVEVEA